MALEAETEAGGERTICYPARGSWCATCPPGHCDTEQSGQSDEDLDYSDSTPDDVTSGRSWGFCDSHCFRLEAEELEERRLEERTVRLRPQPGQARQLAATHWAELELPLYKVDNSGSGHHQVGSSHLRVSGGSGSCQADPGGPLYVTEGDSATLIGLATGARDCPTNNSRGIFLRSLYRSSISNQPRSLFVRSEQLWIFFILLNLNI